MKNNPTLKTVDKILKYLEENGHATRRSLFKELGVNWTSLKTTLSWMYEYGFVNLAIINKNGTEKYLYKYNDNMSSYGKVVEKVDSLEEAENLLEND